MKKAVFAFCFACAAAALMPAQGGAWSNGGRHIDGCGTWGRGGGRHIEPRGVRAKAEEVSLTGNLSLAQGQIAIKDGETTYFIAGLHRFIGFIDGLKEGAKVTVTGNAWQLQQESAFKMLRPVKISIGGKEYELAPANNSEKDGPFMPRGRRW
ncbi:MAG: hypothetical protein LBG79_09180 [Spirochaetaceae bacterium]|nr:hypothetical protein [Spirochaetaceae bacterium]GMO26370.1 MAG: hypothetical protein Pg6A_13630 [Termitinemataceae bacterium]